MVGHMIFSFKNCMKHLYQSFSFFLLHDSIWTVWGFFYCLGFVLHLETCFAVFSFFAVSFWSALSTEKRNWWLWTADWSGYPFSFSFFHWFVVGFVFVSSASLSSPSNIEYTIIAREPGEWVNVFFMCFSVFFLLVCICLCTTLFCLCDQICELRFCVEYEKASQDWPWLWCRKWIHRIYMISSNGVAWQPCMRTPDIYWYVCVQWHPQH